MSRNFETLGLFPVPVIKIKFKDHYKYNFSEVEKRDEKPDDWISSVHTSFPGISNDDPIVSSSVRDSLESDLKNCIGEVFKEIGLPTTIKFTNMWYNIYHENQGQEPHRHLPMVGGIMPFWSGIYYNKNASPTKFIRDDKLFITQLFEGYENSEMAFPLSTDFSPKVKDGDILLFPPHLEHLVESKPHHKDKMRMTFSFNINLI